MSRDTPARALEFARKFDQDDGLFQAPPLAKLTANLDALRRVLDAPDAKRDFSPCRVVNFGPVTLPELAAVGITTVDRIERLGADEVCRRWVERYPGRLNVNAVVGVVATLEGVPRTRRSADGRARARRIVDDLKAHFGKP